jgi:cell pole-organizing protein PopZ
MSREAFMRSSGDPAEQRYFTPVTPHDPIPAAKTSSTPKPEIERIEEPTARPGSGDDRKVAATEAAVEAEKVSAKAEPEVRSETAKPDLKENIELKTVVEEEQKSLTPEPKAEAAVVETPPVETNADEEIRSARDADLEVFANIPERRETISEDRETPRNGAPAAAASRSKFGPEFSPIGEPRLDEPSVPAPEMKLNGSASAPIASPDTKPAHATPESNDGNDPFSFDLGPSPFAARVAAEKLVEPKNGSVSAAHEGASRSLPRNEEAPRSDLGWPKINGSANGSALSPDSSRPDYSRSDFSRSHERAPEAPSPARPPASFAVPSVSATLGPHRRLEPLSEAFKPASPSYPKSETPSLDAFSSRDYMRHKDVEPSRAVSDTRLRPEEPLLSSDGLGNALASGDRTMEDAVADLLRPLLKTWLAENMPKIVERALRREMTERLLPGHKNPRD